MARVPCVPPYCHMVCQPRPAHVDCQPGEREAPATLTCQIGVVRQTFRNIIFGIPEQDVVACIPEKTKAFATIVPGKKKTYIFGLDGEDEYKRDYRSAMYAYTWKKAGWDCMRHYEILASGTLPYFTDLSDAPSTVMSLLPKKLIFEGMTVAGVTKGGIDHEAFDSIAYYSTACRALAYTRKYLTTKAVARYVLETMGKKNATKVLILTGKHREDYMRDLVVHGMRELLGPGALDVPAFDHMYDHPTDTPPLRVREKDAKLWGRGFTYGHRLPRIHLDRDNIPQRIKSHEFDVVIYAGNERRIELPHLDLVLAEYGPSAVAFIDGDDWWGWERVENPAEPRHRLLGRAFYFFRELPDHCPGAR